MTTKEPPIGFLIAQTAKTTTRNFENCLTQVGGSLSSWLILLALQSDGAQLQSVLMEMVGIQGPTLTYHLNGLEREGLIVRERLTRDRRSHNVTITLEGHAYFNKMRDAANSYDAKLRGAISVADMQILRDLLSRLAEAAQQ